MEHNKRGYLFKKIISIVLTVIFTFSLLGNQSAIVAKAEEPGPTEYKVTEDTILYESIDVGNVEISEGVTLTIAEGGYLAANKSFVLGNEAKIVTELDYPVIEIREHVTVVTGFTRYFWDDENQQYTEFTTTGECHFYQYQDMGSGTKGWVIMDPGPLDWFSLEDTSYDKELQFDLSIPENHGSVAVTKINGGEYTKSTTSVEQWESDKTANTAEFSDEWCNMTRLHVNNLSGNDYSTVEFNLSFVSSNQNFNFDVFDYYSEGGDPTFHVDRWELKDPEYQYNNTPIVSYTPAQDGMSATIVLKLSKEHTDAHIELCRGMEPGVGIRYNEEISSSISSWLNDSNNFNGLSTNEFDPDGFIYNDGASEYSIDYSSLKDIENYKGYTYRVLESEWDFSDKVHVSSADKLTLNPEYYYDIELLVGQETPLYDHKYCASIPEYDNGFEFKINNSVVEHNKVVDYSGESLTFTYTNPDGSTDVPYVLLRYEMTPDEVKVDFTGNSALVNTEGYPVFIDIFQSEAEYRYNRLPFDFETQTMVDYYVGEHGSISFTKNSNTYSPSAQATLDGRTRMVVNQNDLFDFTITADQGYCIDMDHFTMRDISNNEINVKNAGSSYISNLVIDEAGRTASGTWNVGSINEISVEFKTEGGNTPGSDPNPGPGGDPDPIEPGHDGEAFKKLIESKQYAFGDWDNDNDVDTDDLKLGIAQMIYYPEFNSNAGNSFKKKHNYPEVISVDYLKDLINLTESASDNLSVAYRGGTLTLPAYKYTVTFNDTTDESRSFKVEGIGYLFKFDGLSEDYKAYKDYSNENVIMYATQGSTTKYFLRNTHGEENNPSKDCQDPVTGNASGEGAFCAVADYDCGSQYNEYGRNIGIFGNGASLDNFIMSDPSESEFITLQGRNEDFARDTGHNGRSIFGKFSFYKPEFTGMKIQGKGQNGNTPAWSFATDPIWGSDTDINTDSEAVVYFGNSYVYFYPVTINNFVTKITGFEKVDSRIPDGAVSAGITDNGALVYFNSNFYDMVEFKVTYETESGGSKTEYIWLHRVGIDINEGHFNAGESILHHGTENGPKITLNQSYESLVYATYYYPEPNGTDEYVDLYATYTWKDGSVTKKLIANDSSLNLAFHHKDTLDNNQGTDDLQSSDFILYKGSKEGAPVKVEVSAVKSGSTDTEFKGMMFGSGRGVCYTLGK